MIYLKEKFITYPNWYSICFYLIFPFSKIEKKTNIRLLFKVNITLIKYLHLKYDDMLIIKIDIMIFDITTQVIKNINE